MPAAEVDVKVGAVEVKKVEPLFGPLTGRLRCFRRGRRFLAPLPPEGEVPEPHDGGPELIRRLKKRLLQVAAC